jgi:hypothetical protein
LQEYLSSRAKVGELSHRDFHAGGMRRSLADIRNTQFIALRASLLMKQRESGRIDELAPSPAILLLTLLYYAQQQEAAQCAA